VPEDTEALAASLVDRVETYRGLDLAF